MKDRRHLSKIVKFIQLKLKNIARKPQQQLRMQLTNLKNLEDIDIPSNYQIRTYHKGDDEAWIKIIKSSFGQEYPANIKEIVAHQEFDADGLFFISHCNQPIGTVCAKQQFTKNQKIGCIHMLGVNPIHQGKKLGRVLVLRVLHYFKKRRIQHVFLDTDDFRLSAIKTYISLGFKPVYLNRSHRQRWKKILTSLQHQSTAKSKRSTI